ncbi:MAG: tetratricopeptide repeat protein [Myxococcales bacterium]|nr:tetratricopeptide repeat protein [Myxococcales bacterium]
MAQTTYALYASASFHGEVVEEGFVRTGEPLQIGNSPTLAVPVPEGCPYVARVLWNGPASCTVRDGLGNLHELGPDSDITIELGPVSLHLYMVEQFRIRRAQPISTTLSLAWLAVVLMSTLLTMQATWANEHFCFAVTTILPERVSQERFSYCYDSSADSIAGSFFSAEYLARLLKEDYEGEDQGVVELEIDRPDAERELTNDVYLPAGDEGPITEMGGAEEVSPEPVRSVDDEDIPLPQRSQEEEVPLFMEGSEAQVAEAEETDEQDGIADGFDEVVPEEEQDLSADPPSEEEEGWGVQDWYDERDAQMEELEIELMLRMAQHRLRIDPNDPGALSILSYYQYLAEDFDAALDTYDRIIELMPDNPAGYNNKALVYKRRGKYDEEEQLYRVALTYQPMDVTAMNNLAVNLAHQGRFEEALAVMQQLETLDPEDPYADLHRSKIYAEMGEEDQALVYLRKALEGMARLDTLHHIEFRQDIRVDPSFAKLRGSERFRSILLEFYGDDSPLQD